jgi:hypothetical protein
MEIWKERRSVVLKEVWSWNTITWLTAQALPRRAGVEEKGGFISWLWLQKGGHLDKTKLSGDARQDLNQLRNWLPHNRSGPYVTFPKFIHHQTKSPLTTPFWRAVFSFNLGTFWRIGGQHYYKRQDLKNKMWTCLHEVCNKYWNVYEGECIRKPCCSWRDLKNAGSMLKAKCIDWLLCTTCWLCLILVW